MSEVIDPAAESAAAQAGRDPRSALKSITFSILVNAIAPFVVYKVLAPHFRANSIAPLLYASAFPFLGLLFGLARTRAIDTIAIFALFGIAYSLATTLLAGEVHLALILGATQGFIIAGVFLGSALTNRPILFFVARQFVAGNDPRARARFAAINTLDGGRTYFLATMLWAAATASLTGASLGLAFVLPPATYILANNIMNISANLLLVVLTLRFVRTRLDPLANKVPA